MFHTHKDDNNETLVLKELLGILNDGVFYQKLRGRQQALTNSQILAQISSSSKPFYLVDGANRCKIWKSSKLRGKIKEEFRLVKGRISMMKRYSPKSIVV